jgi:crotonobetainyl-CoA:carnitine CoA-transferase CaiB-like acyl-CoA transferase
MKSIAHPIVFNGAERAVATAPPLHGQHTRQVLERAGYSADAIAQLVASGVVSS